MSPLLTSLRIISEITVRGKSCAHQFSYKGQNFVGCTTFDGVFGAAWCSLAEVFDGRWENCRLPLRCEGIAREFTELPWLFVKYLFNYLDVVWSLCLCNSSYHKLLYYINYG